MRHVQFFGPDHEMRRTKSKHENSFTACVKGGRFGKSLEGGLVFAPGLGVGFAERGIGISLAFGLAFPALLFLALYE